MDFKFKEEILLDIGPEPNCNYESESNRYYDKIEELDLVYTQASKADEYEANLNEVKRQLKIKIRHARRDGDYSEAGAFSEALDMIENLI